MSISRRSAFALLRRQHGHVIDPPLSLNSWCRTGTLGAAGRSRAVAHRRVQRSRSVGIELCSTTPSKSRCVALCLAHPIGLHHGAVGWAIARSAAHAHAPSRSTSVCHMASISIDAQCRAPPVAKRRSHARMSSRLSNGIVIATSPGWRSIWRATCRRSGPCIGRRTTDPRRKMCTMATLGATARRLCHPSRPGSVRFARSLIGAGRPSRRRSRIRSCVLADALRATGCSGRTAVLEISCFRTVQASDSISPFLRLGGGSRSTCIRTTCSSMGPPGTSVAIGSAT